MFRQSVLGAGLLLAIMQSCAYADDKLQNAQTAPAQMMSGDTISSIQNALNERRYVDANTLLDQAKSSGTKDPMLVILAGELELARGQDNEALEKFQSMDGNQAVRGRALQDEGITLSAVGRSDEAVKVLQDAVIQVPSAWRAWNALGSEYDQRQDWAKAGDAYNHALVASDSNPIVLNNRGFSHLLQRRLDDAIVDFLAALKAKPDLAPARTNLRLALAMKGDYDRAVKSGSGGETDQALLLNNAGVAAMMRNDLLEAQKLMEQAIKTKGTYYARAEANLQIVRKLLAQGHNERPPGDASNNH